MPFEPEGDSCWRPKAPLANLEKRAALLAQIREFFTQRHVLEVETPQLSAAAATDIHLTSIRAGKGYLHTSPEFPMKRLLAAGSGDIYQIAKVFRAGEAGRHHNPEFSLLEWYRVGWDYWQLMDEVATLLAELLSIESAPGFLSYTDAFHNELALDPAGASTRQLADAAAARGVEPNDAETFQRDDWLDLLAGACVWPRLGQDRVMFVYDYPASQAALSRVRPGDPPLAERFEVFYRGLELGNGFTELTGAHEQRQRFKTDLATRHARHLDQPPMDERLLAALDAGFPDCAGVAVGIDRVVMLACGAKRIADVIPFPADIA
jgi:lysyl-tRNA synthetase class 2